MDDIPSNIGYLANNFNIGYIQMVQLIDSNGL